MTTNGKLPSSVLVALSTPGFLLADAAASYERLLLATGTTGTTYGNHAYRTYAEQASLFRQNYTTTYTQYAPGVTDRRTWLHQYWYRKKGGVSAAVPGTSNHGLGLAVDFQGLGGVDSAKWKRFATIAPTHGFSNKEGRAVGELWHWVYNGTEDQFKNPPPTMGSVTMFVSKYGSSQYRLITGDRIVPISEAAAMTMRASGVPYGALPNADIQSLEAALIVEGGGTITMPVMTFDGTITPK